MKKFYYKKNDSLDKTPIILRLDRRHTMDINKDGAEEERSRIFARTASVGSVDQLKDMSTVPKIKNREVTKSFSEDVLSKSHLKRPPVVITETELSSSLLYKARKASLNSKDFQQKTHQQADLSPVMLKDPKLKPVPVKTNARRKKSSCFCYLATMMAISLCTVGLLAAITGIIYHEIFPDTNLTSLDKSESRVDILYLIPATPPHDETHNYSTTHGSHVVNNETLQKSFENTDDTYKNENSALNLNEDLSQLLTIADNYSTTYGSHVVNNETLQKSFENTDDTHKSENNASNLSKDLPKESARAENFGMLDVSDLSRLLDSRKAEIKFQDGDTIIYQVNSSSFLEYEKKTNVLNDMKTRELDINGNKTGKNSSEDIGGWTDEVIEDEFKRLENLETFLNSQSEKLNDLLITDNKDLRSSSDVTFNNDQLKEENSTTSRLDSEITSEDLFAKRNETTKHNESETFDPEKFESSSPNPEIGDVFHVKDQNITIIPVLKDNDEEKLESSDLNELLNDEQRSQTEHQVTTFSPFESAYQAYQQNKNEHDVESMLMVINEPVEESHDSVISNRNGDINPSETSSSKPWSSSITVYDGTDPVSQATTESQRFQEQQTLEDASRVKPLDMKVSLAEAMKHLQVLDTSNKLLTSRIKSIKPKTENTKQKQSSDKPRNKEITLEKMRYLQNLRLALQENLQRI